MYVCVLCTCVCVFVYVCCWCAPFFVWILYACMRIPTDTQTHAHTHTHTHTHTIHTHKHTHTHMHPCMHAYMHPCIHSYTHTCIHVFTDRCTVCRRSVGSLILQGSFDKRSLQSFTPSLSPVRYTAAHILVNMHTYIGMYRICIYLVSFSRVSSTSMRLRVVSSIFHWYNSRLS